MVHIKKKKILKKIKINKMLEKIMSLDLGMLNLKGLFILASVTRIKKSDNNKLW